MAKSSPKSKAVNVCRSSPEERRWQAQDDLRTLQRAQEIQGSKTRMSAATREAQIQMAALAKVKK